MKTRADVDAAKLRGGFYSPPDLVHACLDRVAALVGDRQGLTLLEPSAGDGAFLRGLAGHDLAARVDRVVAVERDAGEAARCADANPAAQVVTADFLAFADRGPLCDIAVGNPPYVRYQFAGATTHQAHLVGLGARLGVTLAGVSNLWIPVTLAAIALLRPGGAFAFLVPAECFTGVAARAVRQYLAAHTADLRVDLYPPGAFGGVLQEVVLLSGRRLVGGGTLTVVEHGAGAPACWASALDPDNATWTRVLLGPAQQAAYDAARALPAVRPLATTARFTVAVVTGANDFFTVDAATVAAHGLAPWARPLIARARHVQGLVVGPADHAAAVAAGEKGFLLDFAPDRPDPLGSPGPAAYLAGGVDQGLPLRYKCAIREPWFRVPHVRAGALMLSKRCHRHPRLLANDAMVHTTDTIYRGTPAPGLAGRDLVAGFHNSLTLLGAELEGRSFGGGVLELVPSEVGRLPVPWQDGFGRHLAELDARVRAGEEPIAATDALWLAADVGLDGATLARLDEARRALMARRLARG